MGINIGVFNKIDGDFIQDKKFDSSRYQGDSDFVMELNFTSHENVPEGVPVFHRPENLLDATKWVRKNIKPINQSRFFNVLNKMVSDKDLYFYFSF